MTQREFYQTVATNPNLEEEVKAFAEAGIAKMDAENAKRKNTASKKSVENAPLVDQIVNEVLAASPITASDVAVTMGMTVQKASTLLRAAVADGRAIASDVKVPKKGIQKGYVKA